MSAVKKIGVVIAVGVIISVAYYFLKKSKPIIAEEQLADLGSDTVTLVEEELAPVPTIEEQLLIDKCAGLPRSEYDRCMGVGSTTQSGTRGNTGTGTTGGTNNTSSTSSTGTSQTQTSNQSSTNTSSSNTNTSSTPISPTRGNTSSSSSNPRVVVSGGRRN
jgi:hypothetical protein